MVGSRSDIWCTSRVWLLVLLGRRTGLAVIDRPTCPPDTSSMRPTRPGPAGGGREPVGAASRRTSCVILAAEPRPAHRAVLGHLGRRRRVATRRAALARNAAMMSDGSIRSSPEGTNQPDSRSEVLLSASRMQRTVQRRIISIHAGWRFKPGPKRTVVPTLLWMKPSGSSRLSSALARHPVQWPGTV